MKSQISSQNHTRTISYPFLCSYCSPMPITTVNCHECPMYLMVHGCIPWLQKQCTYMHTVPYVASSTIMIQVIIIECSWVCIHVLTDLLPETVINNIFTILFFITWHSEMACYTNTVPCIYYVSSANFISDSASSLC